MFHKIKHVKPLENYILEITFQNGIIKHYNISTLFKEHPMFLPLANINGLFKNVKIDTGGYGIFWNDEIDISCNELWNNGYKPGD